MSNVFEESSNNDYKFSVDEEVYMEKLRKSVKEKADYDLRAIIGISQRFKDKVATNQKNEYGDVVEDWDKLTTKDLISFYTEASAWDFFSTPIKMQAFIESSLADIVYKYEFNSIISDPDLKGTVASKTAMAELDTLEKKFASTYRKLYSNYVEEVTRSFGFYIHRIEKVINWRQIDERSNPNRNPFSK